MIKKYLEIDTCLKCPYKDNCVIFAMGKLTLSLDKEKKYNKKSLFKKYYKACREMLEYRVYTQGSEKAKKEYEKLIKC